MAQEIYEMYRDLEGSENYLNMQVSFPIYVPKNLSFDKDNKIIGLRKMLHTFDLNQDGSYISDKSSISNDLVSPACGIVTCENSEVSIQKK